MASRINKDPRDPQRQKLQRLLRRLREQAGIRQEDVADKLGKPQSFVSKYEAGERRLDLIDTREICLALGITLVEFSQMLERELANRR
jgi:transcriptional regulator with XRE-family HTH domain